MSEHQSSSNSSSTQPSDQLHDPLGSMDGVSQLLNGAANQPALPPDLEPMDLWEAAEPDSLTDSPSEQSVGEAVKNTVQDAVPTAAQRKAKAESAVRETELLALIHDLNECNDALLARVAQLEGSLEKTQTASKAEVEKAQAAAQAIQNRLSKQMSAEQASVQQVSQNAQQQVAKVVTQLEATEQALSRQQLINENLQTELDNSLERIAQLERDCTLNAQKHAEEAKARVKAETTSRDLKSRLQRQQRYTLQFKAALEKSLTVSTKADSTPFTAEVARPVPFQDAASVVMPKAQRIMPWASATSTSPFQGIDPHLETLIRSVGKPSEPEVSPPKAEAPETAVNEPAAPEAEAKLWHDLERVMETAAAVEPVTEKRNPADKDEAIAAKTEVITEASSAPKLNWQAESKVAEVTSSAEESIEESAEEPTEPQAEPAIAPMDVEKSFAAATRKRLETAVTYTEPSPWGKPLTQAPAQKVETKVPAEAKQLEPQLPVSQDYLPAIESTTDSTIAPVVNPLRTQKKIGSLASVELPTFPNAKVGSFKR